MGGVARRQFLIAAGAALAAAPAALRAQSRAPYRIGLLPDHRGPYYTWLLEGLHRHGWLEQRDFVFVQSGFMLGFNFDEAVRRVVSARPDVIFAVGTHYAIAVQRLTQTIPTVLSVCGYPVEAGLANSLSHPGKNFTGNAAYAGTAIWGKLLELLHEVRPEAKRVGALMSYLPPYHPQAEADIVYEDMRQSASRAGLAIHFTPVTDSLRLEAALNDLAHAAPDVVILTAGIGVWPVREKVLAFALDQRWPTITDIHWNPQDVLQPMMSYSPSMRLLIHDGLEYVVRILRDGVHPGELPFRLPTRFELVINLRTAKALGIEIPAGLLLRADRVIE
jgi:putative tryptophan/tyrosine transport system substrate-binding protein